MRPQCSKQRVAAHGGSTDTTTIATYRYLADNRRASKVVENCGLENVASDGGDTTTHFYYGGVAAGLSTGRWNVFETRNGSNQATRQWVYGTQYVDEILLMDVNGDPATDNDCDQDVLTRLEDQACQSPCEGGDGDRRYFYVQDRNWNVVALTAYCSPGLGCNTSNAQLVERYSYTPYGEFVVLGGAGDSGEWANARATSGVGNIFFHQGLAMDQEKGSYQNRRREYTAGEQRFAERDPTLYVDGLNIYAYLSGNPGSRSDTDGMCSGAPPSVTGCNDGGQVGVFQGTQRACSCLAAAHRILSTAQGRACAAPRMDVICRALLTAPCLQSVITALGAERMNTNPMDVHCASSAWCWCAHRDAFGYTSSDDHIYLCPDGWSQDADGLEDTLIHEWTHAHLHTPDSPGGGVCGDAETMARAIREVCHSGC